MKRISIPWKFEIIFEHEKVTVGSTTKNTGVCCLRYLLVAFSFCALTIELWICCGLDCIVEEWSTDMAGGVYIGLACWTWPFFVPTLPIDHFSPQLTGRVFSLPVYTLLIVVRCSRELWNQIYYLLLSNVKCWDKFLKQLWWPLEFGRFQKFPMQNKSHILSWWFHILSSTIVLPVFLFI